MIAVIMPRIAIAMKIVIIDFHLLSPLLAKLTLYKMKASSDSHEEFFIIMGSS
jgi:hypothetical protein